jgi:predicted neutral ceramidase superfamily lipid hydrolase
MANDKNITQVNCEELCKLLDFAEQRLRHNHDALWKEEVHYTWISYVLAGGLVFLLSQINNQLNNKMVIIGIFIAALLLSFIGGLLCYMGYRVIQKEGADFRESIEIRNRIRRALNLQNYTNSTQDTLFPENELKAEEWSTVETHANKRFNKLVSGLFLNKNGIRDIFRLTMILPILFFIAAFAYSIVAFVYYCISY